MSVGGLYYTGDYLVGFADRKSSCMINGVQREEPDCGGVTKVFKGSNYIVAAFDANTVYRGLTAVRVSDIICQNLSAPDIDSFIYKTNRALQEYVIAGTITLVAGSPFCNAGASEYEVQEARISNGSMQLKLSSLENPGYTIFGYEPIREYLAGNHSVLFTEDGVALRQAVCRKVAEEERIRYCPVGRKIDIVKMKLI